MLHHNDDVTPKEMFLKARSLVTFLSYRAGFLNTTVDIGVRLCFITGPVQCQILSSMPDLSPLDVSSTLQAMPNVPGGRFAPVENHCFRRILYYSPRLDVDAISYNLSVGTQ